jgi:hypothetical protein
VATQQLDEARTEAFAQRTAWGEQKARELLAEAGFDRVDVRQVEGDTFNNYYVATAS